MKFRTELHPGSLLRLEVGNPVLLTGSCFAENIGCRLSRLKWPVQVNPLGIAYNPISIHKNLFPQRPASDRFLSLNSLTYHYDFHSEMHAGNPDQLAERIGNKKASQESYLKKAKLLVLSWGTAYVYLLTEDNHLVANCHKQPGQNFNRRFLEVQEIVDSLGELYTWLNKIADLDILITVSPVRHIRDGLKENQYSKSILRVAAEQASRQFSRAHYFPSYEMMMDDLRDYRYYEADLIHPTQMAIDYIWEKAQTSLFSPASREYFDAVEKTLSKLEHRPFQPHSEAYQQFLGKLLEELENYPYPVDWSAEIERIKVQLKP